MIDPAEVFFLMNSFDKLPDMEAHLRRLLVQVPAGRVTTYGALAGALGVSSRRVGWDISCFTTFMMRPVRAIVSSAATAASGNTWPASPRQRRNIWQPKGSKSATGPSIWCDTVLTASSHRREPAADIYLAGAPHQLGNGRAGGARIPPRTEIAGTHLLGGSAQPLGRQEPSQQGV